MQITRQQCQQIANGWRGQLAIAVDNIVRPDRTRQMIVDFYRHFDDVELLVFREVFNGVWDALSDGRVELAIGATQAIPVGALYLPRHGNAELELHGGKPSSVGVNVRTAKRRHVAQLAVAGA